LRTSKGCLAALAAVLLMATGTAAADAQARLKQDTAKAATAEYSLQGIMNADATTGSHAATAAPKQSNLRRKSASSFVYTESWDFQKDGTNEPVFSCSDYITLRGDSTKVVITLKRTNNWCPGMFMKATFYPKTGNLVPA
jgi:hypothetical protein